MNYELAKQLADAGFPQGGKGSWVLPPDQLVSRRTDRVYVPTLSELIEACGKELKALHQLFEQEDKWMAQGWVQAFFGPTPDVAVACLFIALNKKV
jgi:hypothetical protein